MTRSKLPDGRRRPHFRKYKPSGKQVRMCLFCPHVTYGTRKAFFSHVRIIANRTDIYGLIGGRTYYCWQLPESYWNQQGWVKTYGGGQRIAI